MRHVFGGFYTVFAAHDELLSALREGRLGVKTPLRSRLLEIVTAKLARYDEVRGEFFQRQNRVPTEGYWLIPIRYTELIDCLLPTLDVLQDIEEDRIVSQIRTTWPDVPILVRGDSGFARESLMAWCEEHDVDYVFGLARNPRLEAALEPALERAEELCAESGEPERLYDEWMHSTLDTWSRERRVIGKAEITLRGPNPRFVVTSLDASRTDAATVYEQIYCARGEMENRIKEQQLYLFADRTSARAMRVNQLRLWYSSVAYLLLAELRRLGLAGSAMARARCDTIRLKLLKIGARVRVSVRRVTVSLASSCPFQEVFWSAWGRLVRAGPPL